MSANDYLSNLNWGSGSGSAETTLTLGNDVLDVRQPPSQYHVSGLQITRMKNLLISMSTYYKGGARLQVIQQSSNPFATGETGFYADNSGNPKFYNGSGSPTTLGAAGGGLAIGGAVTSGTVGSVLFIGAGTLLAQDNTNFYWDDTNNRLGVNVNAPAARLHIRNGTSSLTSPIDSNMIGLFDGGGNTAANVYINVKASGSGGTDSNIYFSDTGTIKCALRFNVASNYIALRSSGGTPSSATDALRVTGSNGNVSVNQPVNTSGTPNAFVISGAAHTTLAAGTESIDFDASLARTVQFATGAITTQRACLFRAPTYAFVGASTITDCATVAILAAPVLGANATFTRSHALWVQAGLTTLAGGLTVTGGACTLTANAASSLTTSSGALTITAAAASTWSTSAGALTLTSAAAATWSSAAGALTITSAAGATWSAAAGNLTLDAAAVLNLGTTAATDVQVGRSGQKVGFFGATTVVKQTGGANVTNNVTSGGVNDTIGDIVTGGVVGTDIRDALYQLARLVKQDHDALRAYGLLT